MGKTPIPAEPLVCRCDGTGSYIVDTGDGPVKGFSTHLCICRSHLEPREGQARWWSLERLSSVSIEIPIFSESVDITVDTEVPISADNYRVGRRGNRYWPTLIDVETPEKLTLMPADARALAKALNDAADLAEKRDDEDADPCGHWAPCDCEPRPAVLP